MAAAATVRALGKSGDVNETFCSAPVPEYETINEITPENKKLFVEATRPIYKQFEPSIGKDFLELAIKELS